MDKKEIRRRIKAQKAALTEDYILEYSARVTELFTAQSFYRDAQVL